MSTYHELTSLCHSMINTVSPVKWWGYIIPCFEKVIALWYVGRLGGGRCQVAQHNYLALHYLPSHPISSYRWHSSCHWKVLTAGKSELCLDFGHSHNRPDGGRCVNQCMSVYKHEHAHTHIHRCKCFTLLTVRQTLFTLFRGKNTGEAVEKFIITILHKTVLYICFYLLIFIYLFIRPGGQTGSLGRSLLMAFGHLAIDVFGPCGC